MTNLFADADLIMISSRQDALEDGTLVALDPAMALEAGIKLPVAVTMRVHAECIALTQAAERALNDVNGRMWDVLYMAGLAIRQAVRSNPDADTVLFELDVVRDALLPTSTQLKVTIGPGDEGEPVITILFPEED
jgi:hypothetical protein